MSSDLTKLGLDCKWSDLTEGMQIYGEKTSEEFNTGEWASTKPLINEELCIHCLMCVPVCPDSAITVVDGKRGPLDYMHCKGCGICVKTCPKDALTMKGVK